MTTVEHGRGRSGSAVAPDGAGDTGDTGDTARRQLAALVAASRLRRVHVLAWRDLDDEEAGGSELHAHEVLSRWAQAGVDVHLRTAYASGHPVRTTRAGYTVVRKAGRYAVFPRSIASGLARRAGPRDGLVEIWNGMPFFSPLWARCPSVVFLHHVHAEMWGMVLTPRLARLGEAVEFQVAPPVYRRSRIVTLSGSSRDEIVELLGLPRASIDVVPPGVDARFSPGGARSPEPLVVAVGRLVPVKRPDRLVDALVALRAQHPTLRAVLVGEGYERKALEARVGSQGAAGWLTLPGRLPDDELVALYRRAWVLTSASAREGWGMTVTEAAACATPAVVTRIAGHTDAVVEDVSGLLVDAPEDLAAGLHRLLGSAALRARLSAGALANAARFRWDATARDTFAVLAAEAAAAQAAAE